jgi:membrane protease YdiL (CAAX protease family)
MNVLQLSSEVCFGMVCRTHILRFICKMETSKMETLKQVAGDVTATDIAIFLVWLLPLVFWLVKTSWGRRALAGSMLRRNNMPPYLPFIPLVIWFGAVQFAVEITRKLLPDLQPWQNAFMDNLILCIGAIFVIVVIIFLARISFARRLKGFGLDIKTIHKDFLAGVMNLVCVWPLVMLTIISTERLGQLIWGPDFHIQPHEELKLITSYPQLPLRVLIVIAAVVIAPLVEEMLFRGMFQTMIRSFLEIRVSGFGIRNRAWPAIFITSALFAMVHPNPEHRPALFVIGACMGYAYEKSGSLFRPVFIHLLFNAANITATLYSTWQMTS